MRRIIPLTIILPKLQLLLLLTQNNNNTNIFDSRLQNLHTQHIPKTRYCDSYNIIKRNILSSMDKKFKRNTTPLAPSSNDRENETAM